MQQDAEEALIQLMNAMANVLKKEQIAAGGGLSGLNAENNVGCSFGVALWGQAVQRAEAGIG